MGESEMIQRAAQGDHDAFARLVTAYQTPVYNLAYRMLGERGEAEDAAQEAFIRAYRNLRHYDPSRPFRTWLLSITAHYCIDHHRRHRIACLSLDDELTGCDDVEFGSQGHDPYCVVVQREHRQQVQALLMSLPPAERAAVTLLYWYDYSYEEIAETLGLTVSAVKSRLYRARRAVAQLLQQGHRQHAPQQSSEPIGYVASPVDSPGPNLTEGLAVAQ